MPALQATLHFLLRNHQVQTAFLHIQVNLIPILDSVVQKYLQDDDLGAQAPFAERALGLVRGYQRDLDSNRAAVRAARQELAGRGYGLTEVRILDLLILSTEAAA